MTTRDAYCLDVALQYNDTRMALALEVGRVRAEWDAEARKRSEAKQAQSFATGIEPTGPDGVPAGGGMERDLRQVSRREVNLLVRILQRAAHPHRPTGAPVEAETGEAAQ